MKKLCYMVLGILSFLVLAVIVGVRINLIRTFVTLSPDMLKMLSFVVAYGPMILLACWGLVYFWGKGIKILFVILLFVVIVCGVIAFGFPDVITKIFGANAQIII